MSGARKTKITRRDVLKITGGAALVTSAIRGGDAHAAEEGAKSLPKVPRRVLGKTGQEVPILLFGAAVKLDTRFDPKMAEAYRFGVDYIDAADCYNGGRCEKAVGNFWTRAKLQRKDLWITSKSDDHDPKGLTRTLDRGLRDMQTDYVDLYFMHALDDVDSLTKDMAKTAERLKKEGKIRYFGFSCHGGQVAELLQGAAEHSWIDAIMFRYDFSKYGDKKLNRAMDAARKSNVGLIAMKTQRSAVSFEPAWQKFKRTGKWSKHQAVLKAVWEDERISAAVSAMDTFEKLKENIAAALDRTKLTQAEREALDAYASATRHLTCDGCEHLCNAAVDGPVQIGTTLRYLMYHDTYGEADKARALFSKLPASARRWDGVDFTPAQRACPNGVEIAKHMRRAREVLTA